MRLHSPATRTHIFSCQRTSETQWLSEPARAGSPIALIQGDSRQPTVKSRLLRMELMGIEPTTPGLQSRCSPS